MPSQDMIETTLIENAGSRIANGETDFIDVESVELELALEMQTLREFGFEACLREASEAGAYQFLFQLPALDHIHGQHIAVLSANKSKKLLYAILDKSGTDIEIVPEAAMQTEIRNFAAAFMDVFSQLGATVS